MPFYFDALDQDMTEFGERLLAKLRKSLPPGSALEQAVRILTMAPEAAELRELVELLKSAELPRSLEHKDCVLRCLLYLAGRGEHQAMQEVAAEAAFDAYYGPRNAEDVSVLCKGALGWLVLAKAMPPLGTKLDDWPWSISSSPREVAEGVGDELTHMIGVAFGWADPDAEPASDMQRQPKNRSGDSCNKEPAAELASSEAKDANQAPQGSVVVLRSIGNHETGEGQRVLAAFKPYLGVPLPLVPTPDLAVVADQLSAAFPHAASVIDSVLAELATRPFVKIQPLVLNGVPGAGKTLFAERLFEALGVPLATYPCAGVSDSSLGGAARRWTTGEPCLALNVILGNRCGNPAIILDELDKAGTGRHNGNALDILLPFLEQRTAEQWHDPYIQAAADVSHVTWIATTNDVEGLPVPLKDRCRILAFPEPTLDHLPVLASNLLRGAARKRGLDARWAAPPTGEELDALAEVWRGGSVRRLQRLVEGILTARDHLADVH